MTTQGAATEPVTRPDPWHPRRRGLLSVLRTHRWLALLIVLGGVLRLDALLGFRPALWYNDSFEYIGTALRWQAYPIRPDGYSALLLVMRPLHSLFAVLTLQHLLGMLAAVLLYALAVRRGVPTWLAALGSVPALLDVRIMQIEHMVLSDTLFSFLVVVALVLLGWDDRPSWRQALGAGLVLALASLVRTVGLPLLVVAGLYLLVRRIGWRPLMTFVLAAVTPLAGYAGYYHSEHGKFALNEADGVFLYSRVMAFADCARIHPPADLQQLCDPTPVAQRPPSNDYIWHRSPLRTIGAPDSALAASVPKSLFTPARNSAGLRFALLAIEHQPLSYLKTGGRDFLRSFQPHLSAFPNVAVFREYQFGPSAVQPGSRQYVPGAAARQDVVAYLGGGDPDARQTGPWSTIMIDYQRTAVVWGPLLAVFIVLGLLSLVFPRRRDPRRPMVALLLVVALAELLAPPFSAEFDFRYVQPAVPLLGICAAAAVAVLLPPRFGREPADT